MNLFGRFSTLHSINARWFRDMFRQPCKTDLLDDDLKPHESLIDLQIKLIEEETKELLEAVENLYLDNSTDTKAEVLKELADLVFVCFQFAAAFDLDLDEASRRVFDSNMSKLGIDGKPIFREDGKVLKGPNYTTPNLFDLVVDDELTS